MVQPKVNYLSKLRGGGAKWLVDLRKSTEESEIKRVYPFGKSYFKLFLQFILYSGLFLLIFVLCFFLNYRFKTKTCAVPKFLIRYVCVKDIFLIWLILYIVAVIHYKVIGIPNYLTQGDEATYWNTMLTVNGKFDIEALASLYAPRGYWCYVLQTISKYIGSQLHIDAVFVWLLFPSFFISWMSEEIMPKFYEIIFEKKASVLQTIFFLIAFLYIWFYTLTSVLMDLFGLVTMMASIVYGMQFIKSKKNRYAILAGIVASISCSLRVANKFLYYALLVVYIAFLFVMKVKKNKADWKTKFVRTGLLLSIVSFFIVCIPQFLINEERGHFGFLPYDHDNAWVGRSQVTWSSDRSLSYGDVALPFTVTDEQMTTMKTKLYSRYDSLNMEQILDVFAESPLESFMFIFKKILIGYDIKTNIIYPVVKDRGFNIWRSSSGMVFSFINYFILFSGVYTLLFSNKVDKKEKWIAGLIFSTIVLPETLMKIEWRYIFAGYVWLYYIFAYHFIYEIVLDKNEYRKLIDKTNYFPFVIVSIFIMFCFSFSFCAVR